MSRADEKSYTIDRRLFTAFDLELRTFCYQLKYPEAMQNKLWGGMLTYPTDVLIPKLIVCSSVMQVMTMSRFPILNLLVQLITKLPQTNKRLCVFG
jgi:hypothetical protein